jgi:hypothetical protein
MLPPMRLRSPSQVRVDPAELEPLTAPFPELAAPLARAIYNAKCPACNAAMTGVLDNAGEGSQVQITCFGDPAHVFIFDSTTGHVADAPTAMGTLRSETPG